MYSNCIFCSQHLGSNEALETFPVGEQIAFDAWKGHLWAVCRRCGRWNLAPIDERWEAVEDAEQRFRSTRLRVQSQNIGIAELQDGTRLIRVGDVLPGELAAWRYGTELLRRRRRYRTKQVFGALTTAILPEATLLRVGARRREVVYLRSDTSGTKRRLIRERDLKGASVEMADGGELIITVRPRLPLMSRILRGGRPAEEVEVQGRQARDFLARAMVRINAAGAARGELQRALETMERAASPERIVAEEIGGMMTLAEKRWSLSKRLQGRTAGGPESGQVASPTLLALEMLLHEESERRALAGELEALREQWRQAEEIASIADTLLAPSLDPLNR